MRPILSSAVVCAGVVLAPLAATATTVTTSVWAQLTITVTQPEVINLGGAIHVVTQITKPTDPCIPSDPCRAATSLVIDYSGLDHTNFDIGAYRDAACTLGFTGAIDEVRLFNRALAPAEILSIYQTTP